MDKVAESSIGMRHNESRLQAVCVRWARLQFPQCRKLLFAVPNGYKTSLSQARIAKAEGLVAGVADLLLLHPSASGQYAALCIEMKAGKGRQSDYQKEWQAEIERQGVYKYVVIRCFDDFKNEINNYLCGDGRSY